MRQMTQLQMSLKSWIPTTLSLLILCGCAREPIEVWVDVSRVPGEMTGAKQPLLLDKGGIEIGSASQSLPSQEPSKVGRDQTVLRRNQAVELMRTEREEMRKSLEESFLRIAKRKAAVEIAKMMDDVRNIVRDRSDETIAALSKKILDNAEKRAPLVIRLALIRGYPTARRMGGDELLRSKVLRDWKVEGDKLAADLAVVDGELDADLGQRLADEQRISTEQRGRLKDLAGLIQMQAAHDASQLVEEKLNSANRAELPALLDASGGDFAGRPAQSSNVEAASVSVPGRHSGMNAPAIPDQAEAKLNIWLQVRGYKLASGSTGVPDKTAEFLNWLKQQ